jgi:hypothetical protein
MLPTLGLRLSNTRWLHAHLICHDHEVAITQRLGVAVHLAVLQAQDLFDVLDLGVASDLGSTGVAHVQQLAPAQ